MNNPTNLDLLYQMNDDSLISDEELTKLVGTCMSERIKQTASVELLNSCFDWMYISKLYQFSVGDIYRRCNPIDITRCIFKLKTIVIMKLIDWLMILNDKGYVSDELLNDLIPFTSKDTIIKHHDCNCFLNEYNWSRMSRITKKPVSYFRNNAIILIESYYALSDIFVENEKVDPDDLPF